jgi:excisionase family DNA binding protein
VENELLTVEEVARTLKVTRKAVYDLMRAGRLPYVQIGIQRGRRIRRSALEAFLKGASRGVVGEQESGYNQDELRPGFTGVSLAPNGA